MAGRMLAAQQAVTSRVADTSHAALALTLP